MRLTTQHKIQAGFAAALAFLLLTGGISFWSDSGSLKTIRLVNHTYQVLTQLEQIHTAVLEIKTAAQAFVVAGDDAFLQPYQSGVENIQRLLKELHRLTDDNPGQQRRLDDLQRLIARKSARLDQLIKLRRVQDKDSAARMLAEGEGKPLMDEIRQLFGRMEAEERQFLQQRTVKEEARNRLSMRINMVSCLTALALVGTASVILRRDFQKRRQAEAERDRFFTLSLDMLCISNANGYFKRVSPAFTRTLGWSVQELLIRPFLDFVHPEDRAVTLAEVERQVARGEETLQFENRYQHQDGSWRVLSWRSVPYAGGFMYATARDVTERKQAEEALRRSEENLAVTLHSIGDAVLATDPEGRVTRMNSVAEKLTGWPLAEARGRPIAEVFHIINEATHQPTVIPVDRVLATGEIQVLANHTMLIARHGREWPIADTAAPIRDKDGRILGVVLVFRDVTDEKQAEKTIRESEQKLRVLNEELERRVEERTAEVRQQERMKRLLLENLAEGVVACDAEGRLTLFNRVAREWHGTDPCAIPPEQWSAYYDLCEGDGLTPLATKKLPLVRAFQGEQLRNAEMSIVRKGAPPRFVLASGAPLLDEDGRKCGAVVVMHDVTERKHAERLALRSQRLESLGTLAGGVAHDLNNALAPILMSLALLRMKFAGESQILDTIQTSAKRGADMVRQLLAFAKGAEGARVSIQLAHLTREMQDIIKATFPKNIQLEVHYDKKLPTVLGDATQLHQVLLNLCVNARDAMPNGGTLTLEAESREVDELYASSVPEAKPGQYVVLRVRDTGTGIPPAILDRIFDPFFTTKAPDKGTGLGLSTVMGIVKGHCGFLQVYSQPGQGSVFTVYLPADHPGSDTEQVAKPGGKFRGQGETILLVDDEAAVREIGRAVLRRLNFKPLTATDGADGLIQVAEHRADLRAVITDLHMPHLDGLNFVRALRRMLPDIPVVVASGRFDQMAKEELEALGVTTHVDKPFTEAQLAEVLQAIFAPK
jgi:PAS domain S-box-containing protein